MKRLLVAVMLLGVGAAVWLILPRKAGPTCIAFRGQYETDCLKGALDGLTCDSWRDEYDDSMRERVNNEMTCQRAFEALTKAERERSEEKSKKEIDDLKKQIGIPEKKETNDW